MISKAVIGPIAKRKVIAGGTTTIVTFTAISAGAADFTYTPGRAAEQWHAGNDVNVPVEGTNTQRTDYYRRWTWSAFETTVQGVYDWTEFDSAIADAVSKNQRFSFGIMTVCDGCSIDTVSGAQIAYPRYLHTLMQAEGNPDWRSDGNGPSPTGGLWVPNWNSNNYLTRFEALLNAIANRIATQSVSGVPYSKVIQYIDIRGYGQYGEWHQCSIVSDSSQYPAGTRITVANQKRIMDAHKTAFPNYPLVCMIAVYEGQATGIGCLDNLPDIGEYALTQTNTWGKYGWRKDSYGDTSAYLSTLLENNPGNQNGVDFNTEIMNRYQFAPIVGEPVGGGTDYSTMTANVNLYRANSFGNANYNVTLTTALKNTVRAASKACGYRIVLNSGTVPLSIPQGAAFFITLNWQNIGLAPCYENWTVKFELRTGATVVWTGNSSKQLKLFLPAGSGTLTTDNFTLTGVSAGTYSLYIKIVDTAGYRTQPFPLAITGRNADGSYTLAATVTVT